MTDAIQRLSSALEHRYRIERELGQGGMATVYLAEDLRHKRKVALKVLKPELAAVLGGERFVQEITTTASLQHPHILPLFDSGTADGFLFYVMPYIEGETLREKLDRETQIGIDEAVRITREIADALDYAHRNGVIHRDIKPENILLHDGRPVVADFGIALAVSAAAGGRMTETGTSVGTPHYMSPEQATADKEITGRADIYSLASVLYEMLAGDPPHTGSSAQQVIMKIIADTPRPVTELRRSVPANVAEALAKALEKLPADRFDSAKAFADALANPAFTTQAATAGFGAATAPRSWRSWIGDPRSWTVLLVAGVVTSTAILQRAAPDDSSSARERTVRFSIQGPADSSILSLVDRQRATSGAVVSPDNGWVAFDARAAVGPVVFVRRLDSWDLVEVPDGGRWPFFSPDGTSLGFFRDVEVWTLDLADLVPARAGALPEVVWDITSMAWHPDGRILVTAARGLWAIPSTGGEATLLFETKSGERFEDIGVLPDGRMVLNVSTDTEPRVEVLSADGSDPVVMVPGFEEVRFVDDIMLYRQGGQARATAFDFNRLEPIGNAVVLPEQSIFRAGRSIVWVAGAEARDLEPVWVSVDGSVTPVGLEPGAYRWPRVSPDGRRIVVQSGPRDELGVNNSIRTIVLPGGAASRLAGETEPVWSSDGRYVFMSTGNRPIGGLVMQVADGSIAPDTLLSLDKGDAWPTGVSPDGRWLAYYGATLGEGEGADATDPNDLMFMDLTTRESRRIRIPGAQRGARFSPDGRWVAFQSTETGVEEVYVRPWPGMDAKYQISNNGGVDPIWASDGRTLFYRHRDAVLEVTIAVRDGAIERTPPRALFTGSYNSDRSGDASWDIAPDGRFLLLRPVAGEPYYLEVTLNWIAEVRARLARAQ